MSRIYESNSRGKTEMFQDALVAAKARGDLGMVRNLRAELAACGVFETTEDTTMLEQAVPPKPRGRRPKPRCEHDMILDRCPDCNEELVA